MIDSGSALLMLKKWAEEQTFLLFTFTSVDAGFSIGGTVSTASMDDCTIRSAKGYATLRFRLDGPDCRFELADRRSLAGTRELREEMGELVNLLIFFPPRFSLDDVRLAREGSRVSLSIMEVHSSEIKGE